MPLPVLYIYKFSCGQFYKKSPLLSHYLFKIFLLEEKGEEEEILNMYSFRSPLSEFIPIALSYHIIS